MAETNDHCAECVKELIAELRAREIRNWHDVPSNAKNTYGAGSYLGAVEVLDELSDALQSGEDQ